MAANEEIPILRIPVLRTREEQETLYCDEIAQLRSQLIASIDTAMAATEEMESAEKSVVRFGIKLTLAKTLKTLDQLTGANK